MVNNDRIVPITKIDYLSAVGTVLNLANVSFGVLAAPGVEGNFTVTGSGAAGTFLANQPVKTLDFASGVSGATVYFVAAFYFNGITVAGAVATISDSGIALADVKHDGVTLYKAVFATGAVTITAITPELSE